MGEWKEYTLDQVYDFGSGLSKSADQFGFGYGFVGFKDVFYNFFLPDKLTQLVNSTTKDRETCSVRAGDVFLTRTSETQEELGMSSVALKDYPDATFNGFTKRLRPKGEIVVVPEFAAYYFRSPVFRRTVTSMSSITTRASLNNTMLSALTIQLPDVAEQQAIGACLKSLDAKVDLLHRQNKTLEAMAETLFRQWFVEEAEEGWVQGRLDDMLVLQRGFDLPSPQREDGPYQVMAASGPSGGHAVYKVKGPGVTTGRSGVIGNVYYVHDDFWPLNTSLWVKEYKGISPVFAYHLLKTFDLGGYNSGSAVPTLNRNHVHGIAVKAPPTELLKRFDVVATSLQDKQRMNEAQAHSLTKLRDTLLPKLMSGEVMVEGITAQVQ